MRSDSRKARTLSLGGTTTWAQFTMIIMSKPTPRCYRNRWYVIYAAIISISFLGYDALAQYELRDRDFVELAF